MKKLALCFLVLTTLLACRGHDGHDGLDGLEGRPGPEGEPGDAIVGQTFEFEDVDFEYETEYNIWSKVIGIPEEIEVLESDAILVYLLEDDGGTETFSLLPQSFFPDEGTLHYLFNHTDADVELMIDGDFNLSNIDGFFTTDKIFRFVVIPSDFANELKEYDIRTYSELEGTGIDFKDF